MNEINRAKKWIRAKLAGDSSLTTVVGSRIYYGQAADGASFPYVIFSFQAGRDVRGVCAVRIQTLPIFLVKVVCDGPASDAARTAADRIDEVLQPATAETSDGFVFSARREQPIEYLENKKDSSAYYTHTGGLYRLFIHPVAS